MTQIAKLGSQDNGAEFRYKDLIQLQLEDNGDLKTVSNQHGQVLSTIPFEGDRTTWEKGKVVTVPPSFPLKKAIKIKQESGLPLLVTENKKCLGVVGDQEIYSCLVPSALM